MRHHQHYDHRSELDTAQAIEGWGQWFEEQNISGFRTYLVTLQFRHLPQSPQIRMMLMRQEAERVWKFLATRTVRNCRRITNPDLLPRWIFIPDYPVAKHAKQSLKSVTINDGLHVHIIVVMPKASRFGQRLTDHFRTQQDAYVLPHQSLLRVHAKRVKHDFAKVVDYTFKSIKSRRCSLDDVVIFPKAKGEY